MSSGPTSSTKSSRLACSRAACSQGDRRAHPQPSAPTGPTASSSPHPSVFLISQIPSRTIGGETGLRATAPFLADLLVEDLADDGARLRKRVPELLDALVIDGRLMRIDDEYRLQTEEGAEWEKDYRSRLAAIRDDATHEPVSARAAVAADTRPAAHPRRQQDARKIDIHWGQDEPAIGDGDVPVWIRDEWSVTQSAGRTRRPRR